MENEEKILSVQCKLNDGDFEDVFRIYNETEKTSDKRIGLVTCAVLILICVFITIVIKNITFLFYAAGCLLIGISYYLVPVNKKFIATNKLLFGEWREIGFYPHALTTMEIFDKNEAEEMDADEIEEATTSFSTNSLVAYENARGFLFAESKIVNQFVYVPKRELSRQAIAAIQDFAQNNCSGGYQLLELRSKPLDGLGENLLLVVAGYYKIYCRHCLNIPFQLVSSFFSLSRSGRITARKSGDRSRWFSTKNSR